MNKLLLASFIAFIAYYGYNNNFKMNPFYQYQLLTKGETVIGYIIESEEFYIELESDRIGEYGVDVRFNYRFKFTTLDSITYTNWDFDKNHQPDYLKDLKKNPYPVIIQYLSNNPNISRVLDEEIGDGDITVKSWIYKIIVPALFILACIGYILFLLISYFFKKSIKK